MPSAKRSLPLLLVVAVLLGGFALRVHNADAVPVFVDEYNHIRRAQAAYDFSYNPMEISHGKLLFYYWIGLFDPQGEGTLLVSRWADALASLLTCAAAGGAAKLLFGRRALVPAMAFYALVPFAVFFDRTALADPLAGALASLAAWSSLIVVRRPTVRRGLAAGLLITLAVLAKLTTAGVLALPVAGAIVLGDVAWPRRDWTSVRAWIGALWRRYRRAWIAVGGVFTLAAAVVLALTLESAINGENTYLLDTHLVQQEPGTNSLLVEKWGDIRDRGETLISAPLSLVMIVLLVVLLWRKPRPAIYALAWLLAIWIPNLALADDVQSRYLMAGVGALAALFGGEMVAGGALLGDWIARGRDELARARWRHWATAGLASVILVVWAVGFALPFDVKASTDPASLKLPWRDSHDYFNYIYNAWGIRETMAWADDHGERVGDQLPVVAVLNHCGPVNLYVEENMAFRCQDRWAFPGSRMPSNVERWTTLINAAKQWPFVYVVSEYPAIVPPDDPPTNGSLNWDLQTTFDRPQGGLTIALWRVTMKH
ncbi:glycosyltransferase family 39 protein [Aggregatilinea lenta]|uniref:glycosyltransferase family 39 protein n=1 Tax=Aggregatilinea lenta TaxID=913108 RepID=UPI000E5AD220|nr:glycosyltransferase family 39 protein [Aggregatilinea lenta]